MAKSARLGFVSIDFEPDNIIVITLLNINCHTYPRTSPPIRFGKKYAALKKSLPFILEVHKSANKNATTLTNNIFKTVNMEVITNEYTKSICLNIVI